MELGQIRNKSPKRMALHPPKSHGFLGLVVFSRSLHKLVISWPSLEGKSSPGLSYRCTIEHVGPLCVG